jgi:hypothetical protein
MDYTNNPKTNMQPDESNYKFLADLYGTFDGSYIPTNDTAVESSSVIPPDDATIEGPSDGTKQGPHRLRGKRKLLVSKQVSQRRRRMLLADKLDAFVDGSSISQTKQNWRQLYSSKFVEKYEVDLGEGFTVHFHMLLAET